jgi:hypothetical protein
MNKWEPPLKQAVITAPAETLSKPETTRATDGSAEPPLRWRMIG